jgi:hydroxymethylbilane synthase/uroporphyrinogen III methyltransferase/synthase
MQQDSHKKRIRIAARNSPLSKIQVEEVCEELNKHIHGLEYDVIFTKTKGDCDQKTSLKEMDKSNFFTDAIDRLVATGQADVGVHSAKDLPEPLLKGLEMFALTKGLDQRDVLVLKQNMRLEELPKDPLIGVSSVRREEAVKKFLPNAYLVDIRGTIGQRLQLVDESEIDGVVMAHCALIRLGLTHRTYFPIEADVSPLQGKLAVVGRVGDSCMLEIFKHIDSRNLQTVRA